MARYALIQNSDETILKEKNYDNFDASAVAHKFGPLPLATRIIPIVIGPNPTISDPLTERLGPTADVITATEVTRTRTLVAIPQEEQDNAAELVTIKAGVATLQAGIAAIENGTGDSALQRLARVENGLIKVAKAIIRLAKDQYGE